MSHYPELEGKRALVTGGTKGVGEAVVATFAKPARQSSPQRGRVVEDVAAGAHPRVRRCSGRQVRGPGMSGVGAENGTDQGALAREAAAEETPASIARLIC